MAFRPAQRTLGASPIFQVARSTSCPFQSRHKHPKSDPPRHVMGDLPVLQRGHRNTQMLDCVFLRKPASFAVFLEEFGKFLTGRAAPPRYAQHRVNAAPSMHPTHHKIHASIPPWPGTRFSPWRMRKQETGSRSRSASPLRCAHLPFSGRAVRRVFLEGLPPRFCRPLRSCEESRALGHGGSGPLHRRTVSRDR